MAFLAACRMEKPDHLGVPQVPDPSRPPKVIDMVVMAERDEFDTAYLLSADGDFTPAVDAVRAHGKRVLAASAAPGARLAASVNTFIRLGPEWFSDCYR